MKKFLKLPTYVRIILILCTLPMLLLVFISTYFLIYTLVNVWLPPVFLRSNFFSHQEEYQSTIVALLDKYQDKCYSSTYSYTKIPSVFNVLDASENVRMDCSSRNEGKGVYVFFPKIWHEGGGSGEGCLRGIVWTDSGSPAYNPGPGGAHLRFESLKDNWYIFLKSWPGDCR